MLPDRVILFANGRVPDYSKAFRLLQSGDYFIAANGGSRHALAMQVRPHVVVGDFDSIAESDIHHLTMQGTIFWRFPSEKDETDLELAIRYALQTGCRRMVVVGALGGRMDQTLGNLSLLTSERLLGVDIRCDDGIEEVFFVRSRASIRGAAGDVLSLIPWGGPATGIVTTGLKYTLESETLYPDQTRGISNVMLSDSAEVTLGAGLLLCIHTRKE